VAIVAVVVAVVLVVGGMWWWLARETTPSRVADRPALPSCGSYDTSVLAGTDVAEIEAAEEAMACIRSAAASGRPAEVTYTALATEGEEAFVILRVLGPAEIEQFTRTGDGWVVFAGCSRLTEGLPAGQLSVADCGESGPL
jgi:hypothetical protein